VNVKAGFIKENLNSVSNNRYEGVIFKIKRKTIYKNLIFPKNGGVVGLGP